MNKYIIVLDDDSDDLEMIQEAKMDRHTEVELKCVTTAQELFTLLNESATAPLVIISDLNMPESNGFELRKKMLADKNLRYKTVPFIYWSTSASESQIKEAYDNLAQGFFEKPYSRADLGAMLDSIITYWKQSKHPKKV